MLKTAKWAWAAIGVFLVTGAPLRAQLPSLSGKVMSVSGGGSSWALDLKLTNTSSVTAFQTQLTAIGFRTLTGTGSVTLADPEAPVTVGNLAAGASTDVTLNLAVTGTVQRFSVSETGIVMDSLNTPYQFSIGQSVILPVAAPVKTLSLSTLLPYAARDLGTASAAQSVSITNSGTGTVTLSSVGLTGANAGDFMVSANTCGATLVAAAACTVSIVFQPVATGARSASLSVISDATTSPQSVSLTGTGQTQTITLGTPLTYPGQDVGTTSPGQSILVSSTGTATVNISAIGLTGTNPGDYHIASNTCGATLASGASCSVSITFQPTATGTRSASLAVTDDATASPQAVTLSGLGQTQFLTLSVPSLTYASQLVSTTSSGQAVMISSTGTATDNLSSIMLTGTNAGDFGFASNTCGATLASGAHCSVSITFTPSGAGSRSAALTVTDDATGTPQSVTLTGTGQAASMTIGTSVPSLTYTAQNVGTTSAGQPVTISSIGTSTVTFSSIGITGVNAGDFARASNSCGATLANGANCTVSITFTPTGTGTRSATLSIADDATGSPQSVMLTGTGQTRTLSLSVPSLTFAGQDLSTTSAGQPVIISNTGTATVNLSSIALGGTNAGDYHIAANPCPSALASGANCQVSITFQPTALGSRGASLDIASDATGGPQSVSLSGTGQTQIITLSVPSLTYPAQNLGTTSAAQSVTISSTGTAAVNISSLGLTGAAATGYHITANTCGATLASGANCSVSITFQPTGTANQPASLTIADDATASPQQVTLSGVGQTQILTTSVPALTYTSQNLNSTSNAQSVTLTSDGTATVNISSITIAGLNAGDFAISANNCGATLASSTSCTVSITFTPTALNGRTASLSIADDANASPQSVSLNGTGQAVNSTLGTSVSSLTYSVTDPGVTSAAQPVTVSNTGTVTVNFTSIALTGANAADYAISGNTCGATLATGASCAVSITFTPTAAGTRTAALTLTDDAAGSPQSVTLTGAAQTKSIGTNVPSLTFAAQNLNSTSAAQSVTLTDTGTGTVAFSSIALTGTNAGDFAISLNGCGATLTAGAGCSVSITFTPSGVGSRTASLSITDNSAGSPQTVGLTGTGQPPTKMLGLGSNTLTFAAQNLNTTSAVQQVSLSSTGTASLTFTSFAITGTNAGDFAINNNNCAATLPSSSNCSVGITFAPLAGGGRSASLTVSDDATGSPQSVTLTGTGQAATQLLVLNPTSVTFSPVTTASNSTASLNIQNVGTATVTFTGASLGGSNSGDFSVTGNTCASLASNSTCTVSLQATPSAVGVRAATLQFTDSAPDSPQTLNLTAVGEAATKLLSTSTSALTFAEQNLGTTSGVSVLQLSNAGTAVVTFSSTAIGGTNAGDFAIGTNNCTTTVSAGLTCAIFVTFTPGAAGSRTATLTVTSDAQGSPLVLNLVGTGVAVSKSLGFSTGGLAFAQNVGATSGSQTVTLFNAGNAAITISNVALAGTDPGDYAISSNGCASLGSGFNCNINLQFTPAAAGGRPATLIVTDDAAGSPQTITLDGVGQTVTQSLAFSQLNLNMGAKVVGFSAANLPVSVTNTGDAPVTFTSIQIAGANGADFSIFSTNCPSGASTLGSSFQCSVTVGFTPSATGMRTAALQFSDSASGSPQSVALYGIGESAVQTLGFNKATIVFPAQALGTTSGNQAIVATNTGDASVSVSGATISGGNSGDFAVPFAGCTSLATGSSCNTLVDFTPTVVGIRQSSAQLTDDAAGSPQSIGLVGVGISGTGGITFGPTDLDFGNQIVSTPSTSSSVTLSNSSGSALALSSITVTGPNAADFAIGSSTCGATLASGSNCTVPIVLTASALGTRLATLQVVHNGAGSPQIAGLFGTGLASTKTLGLDQTALSLGPANIGVPVVSSSSILRNTGTATVTFSSIAIGGANAADFTLSTNSCGASLAVNSTCQLGVTFTPSAASVESASLQISSDATGSPQSVSLTGLGQSVTKAIVSLTQALAFGAQDAGVTSNSQNVTVHNSGTGTVTFTEPGLSGTNSADFAVSNNGCTSLTVVSNCNVAVTFTPSAAGVETATLQLNSDAGAVQIALTGVGQAVIKTLSTTTPALIFAAQNQGVVSSSQSVSVHDTGTATVTFSAPSVTGTNAADFAVSSNGCSSVLANSSCSVSVTFTPSTTGVETATLQLNSDATGSPLAIGLTGVGQSLVKSIGAPTPALLFGAQNIGTASNSLSATARNTGTATVTFSAPTLTGANAADFGLVNGCTSLPVGATCTVTVTFTPSTAGLETATLQLNSDAAGSPLLFSLTGVGQTVVKSINLTQSLTFAARNTGTTSSAQTVLAFNSGTATVTFSPPFSITGANAGDFAVSGNSCTSLTAHANCSISVTFTPTATGARTANLIVTGDAAGSPQSVLLSGTGQ